MFAYRSSYGIVPTSTTIITTIADSKGYAEQFVYMSAFSFLGPAALRRRRVIYTRIGSPFLSFATGITTPGEDGSTTVGVALGTYKATGVTPPEGIASSVKVGSLEGKNEGEEVVGFSDGEGDGATVGAGVG